MPGGTAGSLTDLVQRIRQFEFEVAKQRPVLLNSLVLSIDLGMSTIGMMTPIPCSYFKKWIWGELGCDIDGFFHFVIGESLLLAILSCFLMFYNVEF